MAFTHTKRENKEIGRDRKNCFVGRMYKRGMDSFKPRDLNRTYICRGHRRKKYRNDALELIGRSSVVKIIGSSRSTSTESTNLFSTLYGLLNGIPSSSPPCDNVYVKATEAFFF